MSLTHLEPEGHQPPPAPLSSVVIAGGIVATSGQVPVTPEGQLAGEDFGAQVEQVFTNLEACLAAAGCGFGDVFKVNGYLASLDDFDAYNVAYKRHFSEPFPARTTVQAGLLGFKVEVEAWALKPA